jgi:hypothetical protein
MSRTLTLAGPGYLAAGSYLAAASLSPDIHPPRAFFANGVDQETEPDAAIPLKPGPPWHAVFACPGW